MVNEPTHPLATKLRHRKKGLLPSPLVFGVQGDFLLQPQLHALASRDFEVVGVITIAVKLPVAAFGLIA